MNMNRQHSNSFNTPLLNKHHFQEEFNHLNNQNILLKQLTEQIESSTFMKNKSNQQ